MAAGIACVMMLSGCAKNKPSADKPLKNDPAVKTELKLDQVADQKFDENKMNEGYGEYSFKLLAETAANAQKNNIMISPASIMMALDMCAAGAKGETLKQMNDLFAKDSDPLQQQAFASEMMKRINNSQKVTFSCANAVWNNASVLGDKVNTSYVDYIKKTFEAEFRSTAFDNNTHKEINKWVDEKTNHMIPDALTTPLDPLAVMVLVNAIRFEGKWTSEYKDSQISERDFKGTNGTEKTTMLSSTEKGYFSTSKATGFIKYYEGDEYAFVAILPNDSKLNANDFIKNFSYADYKEFIQSRKNVDVNTLMPEFKSDYETRVNDQLNALGMKDAFDPTKADFTGIANLEGKNMYISKVIHKTHIEVDRKGTKAAAVTSVEVDCESIVEPEDPKSVICDRPYVYAIVDTVSMNPIFIGTVNSVK